MGRYYWDKKDAVEDCHVLDVCLFARRGYLRPGSVGTSRWSRGEVETGSIGWAAMTDGLRVVYAVTPRSSGEGTNYNYLLSIRRTPGGFGGERVWFACLNCDASVRKLYLAPGGRRFLCRTCQDLSYRSRQEKHDPWGDAWAKMRAIEERLATKRMRWSTRLRLHQEMDRLLERLRTHDPLPALFARTDRLLADRDRPVRGPGRPSMREQRKRLREERARSHDSTAGKARPRGRPKEKRAYARQHPLSLATPRSERSAFCVRCRDRRSLKYSRQTTLANGRRAMRGRCSVCGTRAARILPGPQHSEPSK